MGCCWGTAEALPTQRTDTEGSELPVLSVEKATRKEELRVCPGNFVMRVHERLTTHYRVLAKLGEGGFGTVWKAVHKVTGQYRAIKTLPKGDLPGEQEKQMLQEVSILRQLVPTTQDHPNILKIYEVVEDNFSYHIISEVCTGGDLFDRLMAGERFSETVVAGYMRQILSAVAYCHERNIVHRDLKPENLLLLTSNPDSLLKVIDFGISSKLLPKHMLRTATGTLYYMAPEVLDERYNEKCDVWSCGVIMYILMCEH